MNEESKKFLNDKGAVTGDFIISSIDGKNVTEEILNELVETYNPELHEAPNVIGHPETNTPAFGWVKKVYRKGKDLVMNTTILPELAEMIRKGLFKKRSIAWYPPKHPNNPTPGKNHLLHVAWLGAMPPAIKGMPNVTLSGNIDDIKIVEFSDEKKLTEENGMSDEKKTIFTQENLDSIVSVKLAEAETIWKKEHETEIKTLSDKKKEFESKIKDLEKDVKTKDAEIKTFAEKNYELEIGKVLSGDLKLKIAPANREKVSGQLLKLRKLSEEDFNDQVEIYKVQPDIIELGENDEAGEEFDTETLTEDDKQFGITKEDKAKYKNQVESKKKGGE